MHASAKLVARPVLVAAATSGAIDHGRAVMSGLSNAMTSRKPL